MRHVSFELNTKTYCLIFDGNGSITIDGVLQNSVYSHLKDLIKILNLDVLLINKKSNRKNTHQLMKDVINAVKINDIEKIEGDFGALKTSDKNSFNEYVEVECGSMKINGEFKWKRLQNEGVYYQFNDPFHVKNNESVIYRWCAIKNNEILVYYGETKAFKNRIKFYLKPGKDQQTNIRINDEFQELIRNGFIVYLDLLDISEFMIDDIKINEFESKYFRRMIENYLILCSKAKGMTVLNK